MDAASLPLRLVVDLDALSRYHPRQNPYALAQLQHALEYRLGLAECVVMRSSDSGGIHLWYWLEEEQNAYHLAECKISRNCST